MAQGNQEIKTVNDIGEANELVLRIRDGDYTQPFLCRLGGGVMRFASSVFPELEIDDIFAQMNDREPEGRGAHFDVYPDYVRDGYPWIGVYNLLGETSITTVDLPDDLALSYFSTFREPTDEAFEARRLYSGIAMTAPNAVIAHGRLDPSIGLVIPQRREGPHIVHDIVPDTPMKPGRFIKLVAPNEKEETKIRIRNGAYDKLDDLITKELSLGQSDELGIQPRRDLEELDRRSAPSGPRKRPCNLD